MKTERADVQPLDRGGVIFGGAALVFTALYQAIWYIAPGLMEAKLWEGSSIPFSMPFGVVAIFAPLLFAWLCARKDQHDPNETYDTAKH
jgi:hypothetical protein